MKARQAKTTTNLLNQALDLYVYLVELCHI